jgi:hypothetical protein
MLDLRRCSRARAGRLSSLAELRCAASEAPTTKKDLRPMSAFHPKQTSAPRKISGPGWEDPGPPFLAAL